MLFVGLALAAFAIVIIVRARHRGRRILGWSMLLAGLTVASAFGYMLIGSRATGPDYAAPTEPAPVPSLEAFHERISLALREGGAEASCPLCDQLRPADLAFEAPEAMRYRVPAPVELVLAPDSAGIDPLAAMPNPTKAKLVEDTVYALKMQATLAGQDFEIDPPGAQLRTVLPDRETRWSWTARPNAYGADKILSLKVEAVLTRGDGDLPPVHVETFTERIAVDVGLWGRAVATADEIKGVHAALAGVGGTLLLVGGWLWRRWPRRSQPE